MPDNEFAGRVETPEADFAKCGCSFARHPLCLFDSPHAMLSDTSQVQRGSCRWYVGRLVALFGCLGPRMGTIYLNTASQSRSLPFTAFFSLYLYGRLGIHNTLRSRNRVDNESCGLPFFL